MHEFPANRVQRRQGIEARRAVVRRGCRSDECLVRVYRGFNEVLQQVIEAALQNGVRVDAESEEFAEGAFQIGEVDLRFGIADLLNEFFHGNVLRDFHDTASDERLEFLPHLNQRIIPVHFFVLLPDFHQQVQKQEPVLRRSVVRLVVRAH